MYVMDIYIYIWFDGDDLAAMVGSCVYNNDEEGDNFITSNPFIIRGIK